MTTMRQQAKLDGLKRYFTGKPCARGHIAERLVSSGHCVKCNLTKVIQWAKKNLDRSKEIKRVYYYSNSDRIKAREVIRYTTSGRSAYYMKKYGITLVEFNREVKKQQGKCLICYKKKKLVVDHDHTTGRRRGLLCNLCNRQLGIYEKWKGSFEEYLRKTTILPGAASTGTAPAPAVALTAR